MTNPGSHSPGYCGAWINTVVHKSFQPTSHWGQVPCLAGTMRMPWCPGLGLASCGYPLVLAEWYYHRRGYAPSHSALSMNPTNAWFPSCNQSPWQQESCTESIFIDINWSKTRTTVWEVKMVKACIRGSALLELSSKKQNWQDHGPCTKIFLFVLHYRQE